MGIGELFSRLLGKGAGHPGKGRRSGRDKRSGSDNGLYFYVQLERKGEIVRIRLDPQHDLAPDYKTGTYFSRKAIIGPRTIERADATFFFDDGKSFDYADIAGGELVDEEKYNRQEQEQEQEREVDE